MPPSREMSPTRPLLKGVQHKRMQSLQTNVGAKDSGFLDGTQLRHIDRSPERSPERSPTRNGDVDSPPRRPLKSILGENTPPPSATMLALRNTPEPSNMSMSPSNTTANTIANASTSSPAHISSLSKSPGTFDALSTQILGLTSIATNLQREMHQLSRRSKDNASDLVSLKEATNSRDEDIRKSLKDLMINISQSMLDGNGGGTQSRHLLPGSQGPYLLSDKAHGSPPRSGSAPKSITLPRIPTPNSFDRDFATPPGSDGAANVAMLEKIIRDMGTKSAQDEALSYLSEITERIGKEGKQTQAKLEEVASYVRSGAGPKGLMSQGAPSSPTAALARTSRELTVGSNNTDRLFSSPRAADFVGEDIIKVLKKLKDSMAEHGGLTAEVKALVRDLRGEVLGMGREIGRKVDQANSSRGIEGGSDRSTGTDVARIVQDGLEELKAHMDRMVRDNRRQSSSSSMSRSSVDRDEVFDAVKAALAGVQLQQSANQTNGQGLEKEEILDAVREAWETYKPEIELQNFGLERDEILQCLREGLEQYKSERGNPDGSGIGRVEILEAIQEGLKSFNPPSADSLDPETSITREEIMETVKEALDNYNFPAAAIQSSRDLDPSQDGLMATVKETIRGALAVPTPTTSLTAKVLERLEEVIEGMRVEFRGVSEEAKQNVAAGGRDTEQVLDAMKDGLELLRVDMEGHVERVADTTSKIEILEVIKDGLDQLRTDVTTIVSKPEDVTSKEEIMETVRLGFDDLRGDVEAMLAKPDSSEVKQDEIMEITRQGFDHLTAKVETILEKPEDPSTKNEILDVIKTEVEHLRLDVEKMVDKPVDMTGTDEILDALKEGLAGLRADIDNILQQKDRDLTSEGNQVVVAEPVEGLQKGDISNLEVMVTALKIKIESMENPVPPVSTNEGISKEDLDNLEEVIRNESGNKSDINELGDLVREIQTGVAALLARELETDLPKREDFDAIETLLRNTKSQIDELALPNFEGLARTSDLEGHASKEDLIAVEDLVKNFKTVFEDFTVAMAADGLKQEHLGDFETLLREVKTGVEEAKEHTMQLGQNEAAIKKEDMEAIETLMSNLKVKIDDLKLPDLDVMPTKDELNIIHELVKEHGAKQEELGESSARVIEEQTAELREKMDAVNAALEVVKTDLTTKLDEGNTSFDEFGKLLEDLGEKIAVSSDVPSDVKEVIEILAREFEKTHGSLEDHRLGLDEKNVEVLAKIDDLALLVEAHQKVTEDRDAEKDATLGATRDVAEELKILLDTLGTTMTDASDKMCDDSKTVFTKIETAHGDAKEEHFQTRQEVQRSISTVEALKDDFSEYKPQVFNAIKDLRVLVTQHYEYDQLQAATRKTRASSSSSSAPTPPMLHDVARDTYNDAEVQTKLDKLLSHANAAGKSFAQIDLLDQIHQQVMTTASEVSEFVAIQAKLITEGHEDKERQAEEASRSLEKSLSQKEQVDSDVVALKEEKESLREAVNTLRAEKEELSSSKLRLAADVSSLETALKIRREELAFMESRAEGLERRILEGVLDHSRALLISKSSRDMGSMALKRVPSQASNQGSAAHSNGIGMALRARPQPKANPAGRRIFSLSQITSNVPSGGQAFQGSGDGFVRATATRGLSDLKRAHTVKSGSGAGAYMRKTSLGAMRALNKENLDLHEVHEGSDYEESISDDTGTALTGRQSYGLTNSDLTRSKLGGHSGSETGRTSLGMETDLATPMFENDKRASLGTTIVTDAVPEEEESFDDEHDGAMSGEEEENDRREMVLHDNGYDGEVESALGPMTVGGSEL
jgi:hypothetical protein